MKVQAPVIKDDFDRSDEPAREGQEASEDDLWFLPGAPEEEPDYLTPGPRAERTEISVIADWVQAQAANAAGLARVAGRLGALDDRLLRGPEGWQRRLALIEAADLSWHFGDRVSPDRLALWVSMHLSGVQDDPNALVRIAWAVRRLSGGAAPEADLSAFLDRRDPENIRDDSERFEDRADNWLGLMAAATDLHPIARACMGFHLWSLAGLDQSGDRIEAAVTAARVAVSDCRGAIFAPLAMGGAGGLRAAGAPAERLRLWLDGMESAARKALRHLDDVDDWSRRAEQAMASLSGRTPPALRQVLCDWPMVSAPMAEALTGASRAAVQRNLNWMETTGLIHEVTGQGRFRMWRAV